MRIVIVLILIHVVGGVRAQQLDQIGKKDVVKVSGGMGYNLVSNSVSDQPRYRDPLSWVYSGNLSVNVLGVALPFTFSISNAGKSYTQPFNMTALHPSYKWVKTHIGITSMTFSPYTYSGLNFAGGGFELTPKKWKIQGFAGRLKKAVEYDPQANNVTTVSYRRMGYALSVGYETPKAGIKMIVLKAQDDERSLTMKTPNAELTAQDNIVTSLIGKVTLFSTLNLQAEFANSLLTRNVLLRDSSGTSSSRFYYPFIRGNNSTISRNAYNASLNYRYKIASVSLKYERIDPGYLTLGALFFNNDLENITVAPAVVLFKNKVNITFNTGLQRNNLSNTNANVQRRWVGSATVSAQPIKGMAISGSYSNFSNFSRRNPSADPFYNIAYDTMNYYQISENYNLTTNYSFGDSLRQNISGAFVYAKSQNITGRLQDAAAFGFNVTGNSTPVDVYTAMVSHNFQFRSGFTIGYTGNMNRAIALGQSTTYVGPGINLARPFFNKKLNVQCGSTYNRQLTADTLTNHVMNFRLGANISPQFWDKKYGKVTMSLNANYTQKFAVVANALSPKNLTVIANINYGF